MNDSSKQQLHATICKFMHLANSTVRNFISVSGLEGEQTTVHYYYVDGKDSTVLKETGFKYVFEGEVHIMYRLDFVNHKGAIVDTYKVSSEEILLRATRLSATTNVSVLGAYLKDHFAQI